MDMNYTVTSVPVETASSSRRGSLTRPALPDGRRLQESLSVRTRRMRDALVSGATGPLVVSQEIVEIASEWGALDGRS